eukprot:CAMPEP_0175898580 /NCGR_PEP_ID=MMETSP0108-20121206/1330_1 /TAXON_ID=195067 ORGANISM="Goniomonas pacifica, Strain CCMP1869" /NCGR_SAMPLE_ID=MMETSP0108 /ASSEMBLY_ACC=CAM_ASM_000204 /LENGTH=54 /DNA_ID=CAMNT_0017219957 /DNA_START=893 /DNA_END=1054 /DNA_ORIENTATION=-
MKNGVCRVLVMAEGRAAAQAIVFCTDSSQFCFVSPGRGGRNGRLSVAVAAHGSA